MDFLHPALVAGAALAAVPIVLHLMMRQKPKRFEFPALRFVQQRRQANQRRLRLQHLLLLALRIAAICLLALALARPSMRASGVVTDQEAPVAAALVFETAPHMAYRHENKTRLEAAQEIALDLLRDVPHESQIAVLDTRGQPAVFQVDIGAARDRIERLEPTPATQPITRAIDEALRLLAEATQERREVYIFTDMSRDSWTGESREELEKRLIALPQAGVYVIDVGVAKPSNYSLGELRLSSQVLAHNSPLALGVDINVEGTSGERGVVLEIIDRDGKPQKRNEELLQVGDGQPQHVEFALGGLPVGTHQGQARIVGADGLPGDDVRFFTVEVQKPWNVLIVAPRPAQATGGYLSEALAPEKFRKQGLARFKCESIDFEALAGRDLSDFDAVFVLDPPATENAGWQRLSDYALGGGGVAVFLGERAQPVDQFAQAAAPLLSVKPAKLASLTTNLVTKGGEHPLLAKFKPLADQVPWDAYPVYHYWQLGELKDVGRAIVNYANGQPALVEQNLDRGRVLVMTTSISDPPDKRPEPWNRLLTGLRPWPFFMFANEMALYLAGSSDSGLNYTVGQPATLRLRAEDRVANYLLATPTNERIRGALAGRQDAITISATDAPGHYRVRSGGGENAFDRGFSANLPPAATSLTRCDEATLKKTFGKHEFRFVRGKDEMRRQVSAGRVGRELYPILIVCVAIAVGLEQWVANRFYRQA